MRNIACAIASAFAFFASSALPQEFPSRPIRMIVANSPGSLPDTVARTVAPEIGSALGQPVLVENKPGADQVIGLEYVAKQAPADGHTIAVVYTTALVTLPVTVKNLRFDPLLDLPPVIALAEGQLILASSSKFPWKAFNELVANARANPGKLNYGSPSTAVRLLTEALIRSPDLALNVVHVPYNGAAVFYQGIAAGEVHMGFISEAVVNSLAEKVQVLAVTGSTRLTSFSNLPTFSELGYPQIRGFTFSLNVRSGTPRPYVEKLYSASSNAVKRPDVVARLEKLKLQIVKDQSPEASARALQQEAKLYSDIAKRIGVQPQ